jgi:hypothetical protein
VFKYIKINGPSGRQQWVGVRIPKKLMNGDLTVFLKAETQPE